MDGEDEFEEAMLKFLRANYEDISMLTGWVLVAEIMESNGDPNLLGVAAEYMPYWKINGLFDSGREVMEYQQLTEAELDDDE